MADRGGGGGVRDWPVVGPIFGLINDAMDSFVIKLVKRPVEYTTFHAEERMSMHEEARRQHFLKKGQERFARRQAGRGDDTNRPYWGKNPLAYPFDAVGGVPNVLKTGRFWDFGRGSNQMAPRISGAVITGIIGIVAGAFMGSMLISVALGIYALSIIMPGAESDVITTRMGRQLQLWKGRSASIAKAMLQMMALVLGMYALYTSNLPFSALIMLVVGFGGYMALPVEFGRGRSDDFIKSFIRMFLGVVVLSIWVFGNLFQSTVLMFMGILFLAVPPIRRDQNTDQVRAGGEDMLYKIIFLIGMVMIFLMVTGLLPLFGETGWGLGQTSMLVFYLIWGMSFLSGLFSAVEDIPKIGSILLIVALILFGTTGPGGDAIGEAMFGQWWPTVENSIQNTLTPLSDMFSGFSNTFSTSFMMLSNPMGFATQIMDGGYAKNPDGLTGAYGLEINSLQADVIYPGAPFTMRFELSNKGVRDASVSEVIILSSLSGFKFTDETGMVVIRDSTLMEEDEKTKKTLYRWNYQAPRNSITRGDIMPVFLIGEMSCDSLREIFHDYYFSNSNPLVERTAEVLQQGVRDLPYGVGDKASSEFDKVDGQRLQGSPDALKYITFRVKTTYEYSTDSALQISFISDERWRELSRDSRFARSSVQSTMTTGPAKLNLGTMEQPIPYGTPFFIGFNLTTSKPRTEIGAALVSLKFPFEIKNPEILDEKCSIKPDSMRDYDIDGINRGIIAEWKFGVNDKQRSVFCYFDTAIFEMSGPERTFTIEANSEYTVISYENYDTRTAFQNACFGQEDYIKDNKVEELGLNIIEGENNIGSDPDTRAFWIFAETAKESNCISGCESENGKKHKITLGRFDLDDDNVIKPQKGRRTIKIMSEDFSEFSADVYYSITVDKEGKPKTVLSLSNIECTLVGNPIVSSLGIDLPRYPERFLFYENTVFDVNGEEVSIGLTKIKFLTKKSADCFSGCVSETNGLVHYALIADTDINSKMLETLAIMDKLTPATDFRIDERSLDSIRKTANEVKNGGVAITEFYGKALLTGGKITFGITKYMTAGMAALIKQRKEVLKAFDSAEKAINDMAETVREEVARRSLPSEVKEFYKDIPSLNDMAGKIDLWKRMEKLVNKSMYISDEFDIMLRDTDGNEYKATISWKMNSKNELDVEILDRKNILLSNKASPDYGKPVVAGSDVSSDVLMISIDYSNSLNGISGTGPYVLRVTYKVNSEGIRIDADQKDFRLYDSSGNELAGKARIPNSDGGAVKNVNELSIIFDGVDLTDGQQVTIRGKVADSKNSASIKNIDDTVRINLQTKKPEKI